MAGLTHSGFVPRTYADLLERFVERLSSDEELEGLNFRAGPLHQLAGLVAEFIAEDWEATEGVYNAAYGAAGGVSLDRVGALTGSTRRAATRSTVTGTVNLDGGTTLPAGSIAAVEGQPDRQFRTTADAVNSGGAPADVDVLLEAIATGPTAAPAGTLTVIPSPVTGWNTITNAADADLGRERAEDPEYRAQRVAELANLGESHLEKMRAAVVRFLAASEIVGEVAVYENVTLATDGDGRPGKSWELVLWDGVSMAADDDDIAQALYDANPPAGIEIHGVTYSGTATDADTGQAFTVPFSRASAVRSYLDATVELVANPGADWQDEAKAAIAARAQDLRVGEDPYSYGLACALEELDSIERVTDLRIGTSASPVTYTVAVGAREIATFDTADMTVGT